MNTESLRQYCISKKATSEGFPFDDTTLVIKVANKMFALINLSGDLRLNIKCTPENVIEYIEEFDSVLPGYHMNKKYWVTILIDGTIA
ncbi:MAG: MmcQ/YjbR family DNA-binding protein, partial [Flavobacteriaceae bacterium]|nr:MmcQ/YjbR family DNA-binding protein [Flavobacteriaceae bacterium]